MDSLTIFFKPFFLIVLIFLPAPVLFAQERAPEVQNVWVDASTSFSIIKNSFTHTWPPAPAGHVNVRFPFYTGQIEAGVRYTHFDGMPVHSDFHSLFIHLGYSYLFQITSFYQIGPIVRFGDNLMRFDQPKVYTKGSFRYSTDPSESEFAYELSLRNQFRLSRHWAVHASVSYNRTLTEFPLPVTLVSVGVSYAFSEPQWLNHFLQ